MIPHVIAIMPATATAGGHAVNHIGSQAASPPSMFGAILALLLVLGLILALSWLLKRLPGSRFRATEGLKLVASLMLGPKERVVVVDINGQQLLLGVSTSGISVLHHLPEPLAAPASAADLARLPDFSRLLSQKLRKDA